jgi:mono/diheme cytochrome c family protein
MRKRILVVVSFIFAFGGFIVYSAAKAETKGEEVFEQKCFRCHSVGKIGAAHLAKDDVEACVARMASRPVAEIEPEDFDSIEDYLLAYVSREKQDRCRDLFVGKCTQCHSMECVTACLESPEKAAEAIRKMAEKPGADISEAEAFNIEDYLLNYIMREKKSAHQALFESKCTGCHGLEKIQAGHKDKEKAREVVERMARKPKAEINPEDFDSIEDYLLEYIKQ